MPAVDTYFIAWKGRRDGPYSVDQLATLLQKGEVGLTHRVETDAGAIPLRQLLLDADPARFSNLLSPSVGGASGPSLLGPVPDKNTSSPLDPAGSAPAAPGESSEALKAYVLCGLSFVFPPLGGWAYLVAERLITKGNPTGKMLKWLSLGLTAAGMLFWFFIVRMW